MEYARARCPNGNAITIWPTFRIRKVSEFTLWVATFVTLAFLNHGCVGYDSVYRKSEPASSIRKIASGQETVKSRDLTIASQPSPNSPGAPIAIRVSERVSGPEEEVQAYPERVYKEYWSPLLLLGAPIWLIDIPIMAFMELVSKESSSVTEKKAWGCPGVTGELGYWVVGIMPCYMYRSGGMHEEARLTGREIEVTRPSPNARIQLEFLAKGHITTETKLLTQRFSTDAQGQASVSLKEVFEQLVDTPQEVTIQVSLEDLPHSTRQIVLDSALSEILHRPVREWKAAEAAEKIGSRRDALEHYTKAYQWLINEDREPLLWKKIVSLYSSIEVKPALSEEGRRLHVQAAFLATKGQHHKAMDLLHQAIKAAPWHPKVHFDLAILAQLEKRYVMAASEMQRYLDLAPDAPDARNVQDMVYQWEAAAKE